MGLLISILITFLVVVLILWLVQRLPVEARIKQIIQIVVIIVGIIALLKYLAVFVSASRRCRGWRNVRRGHGRHAVGRFRKRAGDAVGLVARDGWDEVGAGDRIGVGNRRRHFNGDGHRRLLVERWLFGGPDGGPGLAQRIVADRQAGDLTFGEIALDDLFVRNVRGDLVGLVIGIARIGHRKSPG